MFWVPLIVTVSLLLSKSSTIPLTGFYPFGSDEGDQLQPSGDDEISLVKLSVPYRFFGKEYINVTVSFSFSQFAIIVLMLPILLGIIRGCYQVFTDA